MAEMVRKWPDQFPAFIASPADEQRAAALEEMDRAIDELRARRSDLHQRQRPAARRARVFPGFRARHEGNTTLPIWMHPCAARRGPDYVNETKSKYEIWQVHPDRQVVFFFVTRSNTGKYSARRAAGR